MCNPAVVMVPSTAEKLAPSSDKIYTHGNTLPGAADFYPLLRKVGNG